MKKFVYDFELSVCIQELLDYDDKQKEESLENNQGQANNDMQKEKEKTTKKKRISKKKKCL